MTPIRIGIIGDFNPNYEVHRATNESIQHSSHTLGQPAEAVWLPADKPQQYECFQGFICAPGSPYRSFEGALAGIRYVREHGVPLVGTCGGFQHLVIEYARNVMGLTDAAHAETDPYASRLVVTPLSCSLAGCGKTRFETDGVPENYLVSTAQPDKKKACVEKTSSSWMFSAT
jgi:CTP synthase (UTP-ammonia lyase)